MAVMRTLARVLIGFVLACLVAALVQVLYVSTPAELAVVPSAQFPAEASNTLDLVLKAATHFAIFSIAFALIAAGIAEWLGLSGVGYWLAVGAGIGLLGFIAQYSSEVAGQPTILNNYALQSFLTAGFFGGFVYWLVAGARAGMRHRLATAGAASPPKILVETEPRAPKKGSLAEKIAMRRSAAAAGEAPPPPQSDMPDDKKKQATAVPVTKPDPIAKPHGDRADTPKAGSASGDKPAESSTAAKKG